MLLKESWCRVRHSNFLTIEYTGWLCALLCAFFAFVNYSISEKFLFVSGAIGLFILIRDKGVNNPIIWFLLVGVAIQAVSWIGMKIDCLYPEMSGPRIYRLTRPVLVLALLIYLVGNKGRGSTFFLCMNLGLLYTLFLKNGAMQQWDVAFDGGRANWGLRSIADISIFSAIALLYLLFVYVPASLEASIYRRFLGFLLITLHFILIALGQMRGIWLALLVSIILCIAFLIFSGYKSTFKKYNIFFLIGLVAIVLVLVFTNIGNTIKNRVLDENNVIERVIYGEWDDLPLTSVGLRINMWRDGIGYIKERPILGWHYPDLRKIKISESKYSHVRYPVEFTHFHNGYIDILFLYGLLGFAFIAAFAWYVFINTYNNFRSGVLPVRLFLFGCASFVVLLIGDLTDPYITYQSGMFVIMLVMIVLWAFFADLFFSEIKR